MNATEATSIKLIVNSLELFFAVSAALLFALCSDVLDDKGGHISTYQNPVKKMLYNFHNLMNLKICFFQPVTGEDTPETVRAAESSLDIKLFGLRADGNGIGSVIYKIGGQKQQNVRVGEQMADKIKLLAVYNDRIEINNNGSFETVSFGKVSSRLLGLMDSPLQATQKESNIKLPKNNLLF